MRTDEEEWARKTTGSEDMASQEVGGRGTHVLHAVHGQHNVGVRDDGAGTRPGGKTRQQLPRVCGLGWRQWWWMSMGIYNALLLPSLEGRGGWEGLE